VHKNPILKPGDQVRIPFEMHPLFRTEHAIQKGVEKNILFHTWGGLGDEICTEPTLRYALKKFKGAKISLAAERPELFSHLEFHEVFDLSKKEIPDVEKYLLFETITPPDDSNMIWLFFSHMLTNCVDFPSLCSLRLQLPNADKEIQIVGKDPNIDDSLRYYTEGGIFVHPGRHWQSKTFPKDFWDGVLNGIKRYGRQPIIIGGNLDDNRGTVDVDTRGCIDLRGKLSISESIWLLQRASVLLTNDSAPLHMAASGNAFIGFIATCKHPDHITHWRNGVFQWREKNFGSGGAWDVIDFCPNNGKRVEIEYIDPKLLESWLPKPYDMADWAVEKCDFYRKNSSKTATTV